MSRDPETVQREIDQTRQALGATIDDLVDRVVDTASPKNIATRAKESLRERAQTPAGKAAIAGLAGLVVVLVAVRVRNGRR